MKKAITPVIAIVLLMMMVVAAAGVAYFWLTGLQSGVQSQIQSGISGSVQGGLSTISIISTQCTNGSPSSIDLTVQNTRSNTITGGTVAVTLNDNTGATVGTDTSQTISDLAANSITTISAEVSSELNVGEAYSVIVTLPTGSQQTSTCIAR